MADQRHPRRARPALGRGDRFTLDGEQAIEEVVHYDTLPLWAQLDAGMQRDALLHVADDAPGGFASSPSSTPAPEPRDDDRQPHADELVERYIDAWGAPRVDQVSRLYHPAWRGWTPTTGGMIFRRDLPDYYGKVLALPPDFRLDVRDWAARDDVVFLEWTISATVGGTAMAWDGIDRHHIRGARSVEGVSYFDSLPLWANLDSSMARGFMLDTIS